MENRLLAKLPEEELALLRPRFEEVSLSHGQPIIVPDEPVRDIYFPLNALLSLVTVMYDGSTVESGTIGREGMSGIPVLLDAGQTTMETVTQVPGRALRVSADAIKERYDTGGALHRLLNRYMHTVVVTGSQSAACNALHKIEARLCRWLMMSADGIGSDEINITQEFLAVMLGVRRSGVSEAAARLQREGLISYRRGNVKIIDRGRLEATACECYARTRAEYDRLFSG